MSLVLAVLGIFTPRFTFDVGVLTLATSAFLLASLVRLFESPFGAFFG